MGHKKKETMHKKAEATLQDINRHYIRINNKEKKLNTRIVFSVLNELVNKMRASDRLFDSLKPHLDTLGSYFDGLRVGRPTEYDINITLNFPVNYGKIKLDASNSLHDYTAVIMPSEFRRLAKIPATASQGFSKTKLWCNKEYKLSWKKFRAWMQSTVDVAMNTLPFEDGKRIITVNNNNKFKLQTKLSGPANTITIIKDDNDLIAIDLVPTFSFLLPTKPINSNVTFTKVESTKILRYFIVPKPNGDEFSWRLSFPFQERYYLKYKNNLKSTIRLIKHFRDVQGFTKLSSYFIKTLFLWECINNDDNYWNRNSLTYLVFDMLKKLNESLLKNRIPNFWCPSHNVLENIKPETCLHWHNRLSHVLKEIDNGSSLDSSVIVKYFSYT